MTAQLAMLGPPPPAAGDPLARALEGFAPAAPGLLERRTLLRRADTKFTLPAAQLPAIAAALARDYAVLGVPGGGALATYRSLYFDTADLRCFHDHRRGRRVRHKVRIRHYPDRRLSFVEVKARRNERVADKHRLPIAYGQGWLGAPERAFLRGHVGYADALRPQLWIDYRRITLLGLAAPERVTIDVELEVARVDGARRPLGPLAIIEVKQASWSAHTPVMRALAAAGLREGSSSKYVAAVACLRPEARKNRLLPALRAFERIR